MSNGEGYWTIGIRFGKCPEDIAEVIYDILLEDFIARGLDYEPCVPEEEGLARSDEGVESD